jgi:hypothetical protein
MNLAILNLPKVNQIFLMGLLNEINYDIQKIKFEQILFIEVVINTYSIYLKYLTQ